MIIKLSYFLYRKVTATKQTFKKLLYIFNQLPELEQPVKRLNKRERFYEALSAQFNRQGYLDLAVQLGIKDKTAQGYMTNFVKGGLLHRDEKDSYTKPNKETQDSEKIKDE